MKQFLAALLIAGFLMGCGGSPNRSPEGTVKAFLEAAEKDDMESYYKCTEVAMSYVNDEDGFKNDVLNMSMSDFHKDMTQYFAWVSGNGAVNCDNGIKKIKVNSVKCEKSDDEYDVTANITLENEDGDSYELVLKTLMWNGETDDTKKLFYLDY